MCLWGKTWGAYSHIPPWLAGGLLCWQSTGQEEQCSLLGLGKHGSRAESGTLVHGKEISVRMARLFYFPPLSSVFLHLGELLSVSWGRTDDYDAEHARSMYSRCLKSSVLYTHKTWERTQISQILCRCHLQLGFHDWFHPTYLFISAS